MKPGTRIIIGLIISIVYVCINWLLVTLGSTFSFATAFSYGPSALLIGFVIMVVIVIVLFILYIITIKRLLHVRKAHELSQVVHIRIRPGQVYQHYKGNHYHILVLGKHSETGEELVAYRREEDGHVYFRPINLFFEEIEWEGKTVPRFTYIRG